MMRKLMVPVFAAVALVMVMGTVALAADTPAAPAYGPVSASISWMQMATASVTTPARRLHPVTDWQSEWRHVAAGSRPGPARASARAATARSWIPMATVCATTLANRYGPRTALAARTAPAMANVVGVADGRNKWRWSIQPRMQKWSGICRSTFALSDSIDSDVCKGN